MNGGTHRGSPQEPDERSTNSRDGTKGTPGRRGSRGGTRRDDSKSISRRVIVGQRRSTGPHIPQPLLLTFGSVRRGAEPTLIEWRNVDEVHVPQGPDAPLRVAEQVEPAFIDVDPPRLPLSIRWSLWRHGGQAVYVGMARSLGGRAWSKHLGAGLSLAGSSLRRNVCELLFGIPPSATSNPNRENVTAEQAAAIHEWLRSCDLSWPACATVVDADQLERRLRREYMRPLNRA